MIRFTQHAQTRLKQRNIAKQLVEMAVANPDFILPGRSGRKVTIKVMERRFLKVILTVEDSDILVITVHWISKFKAGS